MLQGSDEDIARYWLETTRQSLDERGAEQIVDGIMRVYKKAVTSGEFPPVSFASRKGYEGLYKHIKSITNYEGAYIIGVLKSLYEMQRKGLVDPSVYAPGYVEKEPGIFQHITSGFQTTFDVGSSIASGVFNKVLIAGVLLGGLYIATTSYKRD